MSFLKTEKCMLVISVSPAVFGLCLCIVDPFINRIFVKMKNLYLRAITSKVLQSCRPRLNMQNSTPAQSFPVLPYFSSLKHYKSPQYLSIYGYSLSCMCAPSLSYVQLFCDLMDCSLLYSVHGISQARILKWVAIYFSRGSSWPRDQTSITCIGRQVLCHWTTREAHSLS